MMCSIEFIVLQVGYCKKYTTESSKFKVTFIKLLCNYLRGFPSNSICCRRLILSFVHALSSSSLLLSLSPRTVTLTHDATNI